MPAFTRHRRFLIAFGIGLLLGAASLLLPLSRLDRMLVAADGFFVVYLWLMLRFTRRTEPDDLRAHAELSDEGLPLILALALGTVTLSLVSIFAILNAAAAPPLEIALALASVPLGWAMLHMLSAFHYASLYYAPADPIPSATQRDSGGLDFPGTSEPGAWDFVYFAFVLGMTAQTADVALTDSRLRRAVLAHSIASFFYNTVLIALVVNAALTLGG